VWLALHNRSYVALKGSIGHSESTMDARKADKSASGGLSGAADTWPVSAREAAAVLGVSERTIRRAIGRGDLAATKRGGVYRIAPQDIASYQKGRQRSTPLEPNAVDSRLRLVQFPERVTSGPVALPRPLTPLIGREREIADAIALLRHEDHASGVRLLTMTGPGGVGKTRLAIGVGEQVVGDFPDGIWFVSLAPIIDPELVAPAIAHVVGVRDAPGELLISRIAAFLAGKRSLLILDNFEQVVGAAPLATDLLQQCPHLTTLVTSRMRLRVSAEHELVVSPLETAGSMSDVDVPDASASPAVRLFVTRASAVQGDFRLTTENARPVADICRRLDGLPLAIELAAPLLKVCQPTQLLDRLDRRLPLLTSGGRDMPERQQTMRDTIAWSYDLLTTAEQRLFRRLGVFVGGCTLDAAEAIAGEVGERANAKSIEGSPSVVEGIASLVDKSLLRREACPKTGLEPGPRFLMLETVREYAQGELDASNEAESVREQHAQYFADQAEAIAPLLQWQQDTAASIRRLDAEQDNFRAALVWSSERGSLEVFLRLASALQSYWVLRGRMVEGRSWLERAVADCGDAPLAIRASVLRAAGWIAWHAGDCGRAEALCEEGLALSRVQDDPLTVAFALTGLGFVTADLGEVSRSQLLHEEALAIGRRENAPAWIAWSTRNLGNLALMRGDHATAESLLKEALALFERENYAYGAAGVMNNLAAIALTRGEHARAAALLRKQLGATWHVSGLGPSLEGVAEIAMSRRALELAARLLGAAEAHGERQEVSLKPRARAAHERHVAELRAGLDETTFLTAWEQGRRMSPESARIEALRAVAVIQEETDEEPTIVAMGLTRRELEVLRLVVRGGSNREIADSLYISVPTAKRHLTNIFGKLGVSSRSDAAAHARASGLQ
jgi:excisionase family DNA binding protein